MRIHLQLQTCMSSEPKKSSDDIRVTEYEIDRAALTIAHAMVNPCKDTRVQVKFILTCVRQFMLIGMLIDMPTWSNAPLFWLMEPRPNMITSRNISARQSSEKFHSQQQSLTAMARFWCGISPTFCRLPEW